MNILYIGPYRQADGWGRASSDYLKALSLTGHNIAARPIWMSKFINKEDNPLFGKMEAKVFDSAPDVVIQNVLPHFGDYQYGMKNIMQLYLETSPLNHTSWPAHMNLFDEIWVPTFPEQNMLNDSGVHVASQQVPMPFDFDSLDPNVEPIELPNVSDDDYIFYFIGEYVERKNLHALIVAFAREFSSTEHARLVIKTNLAGTDGADLLNAVHNDINTIRKGMRIYSKNFGYVPELIITNKLAFTDLVRLHKRCDCLVMPSRGESTCRPVIEALAMGNKAIVTGHTGMSDAAYGLADIVSSTPTPAYAFRPPTPYLYTSNEVWQEINIIELQKSMRAAFNTGKAKNPYNRQILIDNYSYEAVALRIKEVLDD